MLTLSLSIRFVTRRSFRLRYPLKWTLNWDTSVKVIRHRQCLNCESASWLFQPGEFPSKGILHDCENYVDDSFAALVISW